MNITPYKNGVHSLAEGLRCLQEFLDNGNDPYLMKDVVLKVHHGLETLLKDLLFQRNPIFLLTDKTKVSEILEFYKGFYDNKNSYLFDEAKTITPEETIARIKDLKVITGISNKDFQQLSASFKSLNAVRNKLQHFAISANPEQIIRVLGNLVPRTVGVLKAYYSNGGINTHQPRVAMIPHQPLAGMEGLFGQHNDLERDLNSIYSKATDVIAELEVKYDGLLNEAIKKLLGFKTKDMHLNIKLRDHGNVGAPPYLPEIKLEGWMNEKFEPHRNAFETRFIRDSENICATYTSSLIVEQPRILKEPSSWHEDAITKFAIKSESTIDVKSADFFDIPELAEYLPFIKSPTVKLLLQLECTSNSMYNEHHFDIRNIIELTGSVKIEVTSTMFGEPLDKPTVYGVQEFELNSDNTSIRYHAFVESNRKLRDHHSMELNIETDSFLTFNKP